jgi:hypothetical protein
MGESLIDLIDNVIDEWRFGVDDAMRWSPDAPPSTPPREVRVGPLGLVPYEHLSAAEREDIHTWVRLHGLIPADIPIAGIFGYDESTNEYRIEQHRRRDGKIYVGPDGEIAKRVLRRVAKVPLPWKRASEHE